jgi:hypothetical protein
VLVPRNWDRRKSDCYPIKRFFFSCFPLQLWLPPPTCGSCCPLSRLIGQAAAQACHNGWVVDAVTGEGDSYSGTSGKSTLWNVPVTVVSGLYMELDKKKILEEGSSPVIKKRSAVPRGIGIQLLKYAVPAETFSVMQLSNDLDVLSLICRATIGKSGTFCISSNLLGQSSRNCCKSKARKLGCCKITWPDSVSASCVQV